MDGFGLSRFAFGCPHVSRDDSAYLNSTADMEHFIVSAVIRRDEVRGCEIRRSALLTEENGGHIRRGNISLSGQAYPNKPEGYLPHFIQETSRKIGFSAEGEDMHGLSLTSSAQSNPFRGN